VTQKYRSPGSNDSHRTSASFQQKKNDESDSKVTMITIPDLIMIHNSNIMMYNDRNSKRKTDNKKVGIL